MSYQLCIIIPAFNEAHAIAHTIRDYTATFPQGTIVVIDNNSTDGTALIADDVLRKGRDLVLTERRQGKGAAVKAGLSRVPADVYILVDGDGTYPACDAARLLEMLEAQRCEHDRWRPGFRRRSTPSNARALAMALAIAS